MRLSQKIGLGICYGWWALVVSVFGVIVSVIFGINLRPTASPRIDILEVVLALIAAPFIEELAFRFLPTKLTRWLTKNEKILWIVVLISSVLFGIAHGRGNLLVQGSSGFVFSLAFLKGGYWSSVSAHVMLNAIVLVLGFVTIII